MSRWILLLLAAASSGAAADPAAAEAAPAAFHRLRKVQLVDEHGFERPIPALSLLVPVDWKLQGRVEWARKLVCPSDMVRASFRAESPDGRTAVEALPGSTWQWADDASVRQSLQASNQLRAQVGGSGCEMGPPLSAREYLTRVVVPRARPGAEVVAVEPVPRLDAPLAEQVKQAQELATRAGIPARIRADHARARLRYMVAGRPAEEWLTAVVFVRASPMPAFSPVTGQMGQTTFYDCAGELVFGLRAATGELEAREKLFELVLSTLRVEPEWQRRVLQVRQNLQAAEIRGARERSRIISQTHEEISRGLTEGYERRQRSQDASAERFSQAMRGVQTFRHGGTGEEVELSNQYGRAWSNGRGEYVLSESQRFDPNTALTGSWTELQPVDPRRR